ncbi:hypothetical protein [Sphingobium boeckii]|uniref:Uncharacterized protein n=1 Tax=Sphingobium boeckii TaxID=1082345 RepID=A0A7W9EDV5_9SPHN|nr:hypothetical protein [Sphingobium boeckii]MBB5684021.1 hypothetical protein [Sphingobium boeckii]
MRLLILSLAALSMATPALAREPLPEQRVADRMNDPAVQNRIESGVSAALAAILDLRIGAMERAIDPHSRAHPDDTLRDRAERDDPYFEDRIADQTQRSTRQLGAMAGAFAVVMPQLRTMVAEMERHIGDIGMHADGDDGWSD